jgi:hypothetical protein
MRKASRYHFLSKKRGRDDTCCHWGWRVVFWSDDAWVAPCVVGGTAVFGECRSFIGIGPTAVIYIQKNGEMPKKKNHYLRQRWRIDLHNLNVIAYYSVVTVTSLRTNSTLSEGAAASRKPVFNRQIREIGEVCHISCDQYEIVCGRNSSNLSIWVGWGATFAGQAGALAGKPGRCFNIVRQNG